LASCPSFWQLGPVMEPTSDNRFDPNFVAQILLEIAHEQSLEMVVQKLAERVMERPHIACAQVWLIEKGDLCSTCPRRPVCPDQSRCLHLAAAKAKSIVGPGKGFGRIDPETAREPLGTPPIGSVVVIGENRAVPDLNQQPVSPLDPDWMREEGIRGYSINPISYKGEILGAIVSATREPFRDELRPWGHVIANHIGAAIANARAFEEIRATGKRLEQANQTLERELAKRKETEEKLRDSEQRYRRLVDTASEGIWELDEQYVTTLVNRRMAEMLGYEPKEMVGRKLQEFLFEGDQAGMSARIAARRQGLTERYEQRYRRKDGSTVWMHVSATSVRDAEHGFMGSFAMLMDITERKRAEEALRRLNRELRAVSNCNQVLLRATDEQSLLQEICRIVCEDAGYGMAWVGYAEHDEAKSVRPVARTGGKEGSLANLGITWADTEGGCGPGGTAIRTGKTSCIEDYATDPRIAPWRESALQHGFRSAIGLPLKDEHANAFGSLIIYSAQPGAFTPEEIRLLEELAGDLAFGIVALRSKTARQRAEEALRESETRFRTFVDHAADALFVYDFDQGTIVDVNRQACESLGYTRQELIGATAAAFHLDSEQAHMESVALRAAAGESVFDTHWHRRKDGTLFPVEAHTSQYWYGGRRFLLKVARDITDRKQAEAALRAQANLLNLTHDAIFVADMEGVIQYWNRGAEERYGWTADQTPGRVVHDLLKTVFPKPRLEIMAEVTRTGRWEGELVHTKKDGTRAVVASRWSLQRDEQNAPVAILETNNDITKRKRAEEEARNTAAQWQATFDAVRDLVLLLDKDFRILRANHAAAEFLGLPFDKIVGGHCFGLIHGTSAPPAGCPLAKVCQSRKHEEVEVLARKGGPWLSVSVDPIFDTSGGLTQVIHVARDITERKRAEEALRKSEAYLAEGQRLTHTGGWVWSPGTAERNYWSEEMYRIFGFEPKEAPPALERFQQRIHPDDFDRATKDWEKSLREKAELMADYRTVLPDGTVRDIHILGHPVLDDTGELVEYVGTVMDVTERKQAENELRRLNQSLRESERKYRELVENANSIILHWGRDGRVIFLNEFGQRFFGYTEAEIRGRHVVGTIVPETESDGRGLQQLIDEICANPVAFEQNINENVRRNGERVWIAWTNKKVLDAQGQVAEILSIGSDITARKRAEEELRRHQEHLEDLVKQRTEQLAEAKDRAETANRAKGTFLANMSHELRTPLNAVLGFSRLLKNDPDVTPKQQEALDIIVRSGEHLLNLINNVLDMAKIESGRVALKESEVDLKQLLHEMQSLMGVGAVEKGLRFALERDPDLPRFIAVDAGKLRQVLLNLLGNAIKHTDSGGVKLRARLASIHGSEKAKVRFEVEDSGPGISQEDCRRIFFPFVQLGDKAPAQAGTGLGLAICKQYVELMGGRIGVTSKPGKGSVFYFEIPVRVLPSVAERDELKNPRILGLAEGQPRYRLLIVEDQPENRLLLRRLLEPLGFELREAANGQEAVALFEQWHPDLIWMDIRMPVMDGLEAARRIRATQAGADTKIIALTAHALEEEREPIMAAGCDDLVRKPIREQELFGALARHLRLKFIYEKAPPQESTPEVQGLTLRPEQLNALPAQLLQDLRQAVIELDTARTRALIEQVAERDASLGLALNTLVTQLDYRRLLKLLKEVHSQGGQTL